MNTRRKLPSNHATVIQGNGGYARRLFSFCLLDRDCNQGLTGTQDGQHSHVGTTFAMNTYAALRSLWRNLPQGMRLRLLSSPALRAIVLRLRSTIAGHNDLYDPTYYQEVDRQATASAPMIASSIVSLFSPQRVLDVGCGTGALLSQLEQHGVCGVGLEYSDAALLYCSERGVTAKKVDLEKLCLTGGEPWLERAVFDVVVSMEVAEHLPSVLAAPFVSLLCRHGRAVVFTAATPGQGGTDHVNEQPHEYWIDKFVQRGFSYDEDCSLAWRAQWAEANVASWYVRNVMLFRAP